MNRAYDLKKSMPHLIKAAKKSPPVEIFVLNYSSKDDLEEYMIEQIAQNRGLFNYMRIDGEEFYNSPKARNIAQRASKGEYGIQWACDSYCKPEFIKVIRELIEKEKPVWMAEQWLGRAIVCRKDEFIASGGYDERFNYYAPEDRDFCMRLHRRGGKFVQYPSDLLWDTPTGWKEKLRYVQKSGSHRLQLNKMRKIFEENCKKGVLVANEGSN
jgi:hypothetical protein